MYTLGKNVGQTEAITIRQALNFATALFVSYMCCFVSAIGIEGPLLHISGISSDCATEYICVARNEACAPINHTMTVYMESEHRHYFPF